MQSQSEFFKTIIDLLVKAGVEYMVSGSVASTVYGELRSTNDIDIIIDPDKNTLGKFLDSLGPGYYFSKPAAIDALQNYSMFNIIDVQAGWKIDLIIKKPKPFEINEFRRKKNAEILGTQASIISAEDSIISKLAWAKDSQSQVQIRDCLGVLTNQFEQLDFEYLRKWAALLELSDSLNELIKKVQEIRNLQ